MNLIKEQKKIARTWFEKLRDEICIIFESIENDVEGADDIMAMSPGHFDRKSWERPEGLTNGGGGVMSIMHGRVFEKVGVNVSTVFGEFPENFKASIPGAKEDPRFWASGISLVAHPRSPHVPIAHMNSRMIVTTKQWFGGGGDLTPIFPIKEDTREFHAALKAACEAQNDGETTFIEVVLNQELGEPFRRDAMKAPVEVAGINKNDMRSQDSV